MLILKCNHNHSILTYWPRNNKQRNIMLETTTSFKIQTKKSNTNNLTIRYPQKNSIYLSGSPACTSSRPCSPAGGTRGTSRFTGRILSFHQVQFDECNWEIVNRTQVVPNSSSPTTPRCGFFLALAWNYASPAKFCFMWVFLFYTYLYQMGYIQLPEFVNRWSITRLSMI